MTEHYLLCEAPICKGYATENLSWFPNETICKLSPYTKWQRAQNKIKKLFDKGEVDADKYFTKEMLEKMQTVRKGIEGLNPNTTQKAS